MITSTCASPGTGAGLMLEIFQLICASYPNVCCMKASTIASDGKLTVLAEAGFSADFAVAEFWAAITPHMSVKIKIRFREERICPFNSAIIYEGRTLKTVLVVS